MWDTARQARESKDMATTWNLQQMEECFMLFLQAIILTVTQNKKTTIDNYDNLEEGKAL